MELALISFAALLLLLSGAGTHTQAPEDPELQTTLMRQWFGNIDVAEHHSLWSSPAHPKQFADVFSNSRGRTALLLEAARGRNLERHLLPSLVADCRANREILGADCPKPGEIRQLGTDWHNSVQTLSRVRRRVANDLLFVRTIPSNALAGFDRKQYRTRFGFADGAYRALGPPQGGSSIGFGWYGS